MGKFLTNNLDLVFIIQIKNFHPYPILQDDLRGRHEEASVEADCVKKEVFRVGIKYANS